LLQFIVFLGKLQALLPEKNHLFLKTFYFLHVKPVILKSCLGSVPDLFHLLPHLQKMPPISLQKLSFVALYYFVHLLVNVVYIT